MRFDFSKENTLLALFILTPLLAYCDGTKGLDILPVIVFLGIPILIFTITFFILSILRMRDQNSKLKRAVNFIGSLLVVSFVLFLVLGKPTDSGFMIFSIIFLMIVLFSMLLNNKGIKRAPTKNKTH